MLGATLTLSKGRHLRRHAAAPFEISSQHREALVESRLYRTERDSLQVGNLLKRHAVVLLQDDRRPLWPGTADRAGPLDDDHLIGDDGRRAGEGHRAASCVRSYPR